MSHQHIDFLITLLDDPDQQVFDDIAEKIIGEKSCTPERLENEWFDTNNLLKRSRIEFLIKEIKLKNLLEELNEWKLRGKQDLLEGYLLLHNFLYPHNCDADKIKADFDKIKKDVWLRINNDFTSFEKLEVINNILFKVRGLHGTHLMLKDEETYFFDNIIKKKKGNSLSLCMMYLIIAQKLDIDLGLVNVAENFMISLIVNSWAGSREKKEDESKAERCFYVNPLDTGRFYMQSHIFRFFETNHLTLHEEYLRPLTHAEILGKWCRMLANVYEHHNFHHQHVVLRRCVEALSE